ncbi:hypothetical protein MLD52_02320 [Puniceicoccaceae bacterium K14]|nr:hypothetical protein [Puniceicoccaceae bacterium K14]
MPHNGMITGIVLPNQIAKKTIMNETITVLAPIKLAKGKTEADLLAASEVFQKEFAAHEKGVMRRELVRTGEGRYLDIVQFRSAKEMEEVIEKEKVSTVCHAFFAVMDMEEMDDSQIQVYPSLETYN